MTEGRDELWNAVSALRSDVRLMQEKMDGRLQDLAPRGWVHELVAPIQQSVVRMEAAVSGLAEDAKLLFKSHSDVLEEKRKQNELEWAARTPLGLVKKYGPVIGFLVGVVALFRILGSLFEVWLSTHK